MLLIAHYLSTLLQESLGHFLPSDELDKMPRKR